MRPPAVLLAVAAVTAAGALAAGCGQGGLDKAEQACVHVNRSISLFEESLSNPNNTQATAERTQAAAQLEMAEPLAAAANSSDGTWNGLMTTIGEVSRVSEAELVTALRSQCTEVAEVASSSPPSVTGPTVPHSTPASTPSTVLPGSLPTTTSH